MRDSERSPITKFPGGFNAVSKDYPLSELKILTKNYVSKTSEEVEDEKSGLASELDSLIIK